MDIYSAFFSKKNILFVFLIIFVLFGHCICIVSPSWRLLVTLLVSFWPLYCLSFLTASGYTFGIFFGHCIVSPSWRLLVTLLVSFWPLYCLSFFTASGYTFGIFLAIVLSLLLDGFWLHCWYLFGHCIVSPSWRLLVTLLVSFWPLHCLSFFTASGYTFGIFNFACHCI